MLNKLSTSDLAFENFLGIQLSSTANAMKQIIAKDFEDRGFPISFDEWLNILPIIRQDGISQKEMAKILGKDKTTISRTIDALIRKGVVKKKVSKLDRRITQLHLTARGINLHKELLPVIKNHNNNFLQKLDKKELDTMTKLLLKLHQNINQ